MTASDAYKYDLALCAIFQNEAPFLKEWIEFHKLQGVQHFYLFDNNSSDHPDKVLKPYIKKGELTLVKWPHVGQNYAQHEAYNYCLGLARKKAKWLVYIDTDEFLFTTKGDSLRKFLKKFEKVSGVAGVCVNWQMFGTSGKYALEKDELLIEEMYLKAPRNYGENVHVKTIVRPEFAKQPNTPHCFIYKDGFFAVDANFKRINYAFNEDIPIEDIRINHYFCRTLQFAYGEKLERLKKCHDWSDEGARGRIESFDRSCSALEDKSIGQFIPKLKKAMGFSLLKPHLKEIFNAS